MPTLCKLKSLGLGSSIYFSTQTQRSIFGNLKPSQISLQNHILSRHFTCEISENQHNVTVTYLIKSCGLSPKDAISVSKRLELQSPERPDSVLALLRTYGLSQTQITKFVRPRPRVLLADPAKILLPKLEFFTSFGVSREDLAKALAYNPLLLARSLENQIMPIYNFLSGLLPAEKVITVFKRSRIFLEGYSKNVKPNIVLLRELGMPQSCISLFLTHSPHVLKLNREKFVQLVEEVRERGFNLTKSTSVNAMRALCGQNKLIWNRSREYFRKKWGWSEDDIVNLFRRNPQSMIVSEKKLMQAMDLLVNKMGWPSRTIVKYPVVLSLSLEGRLIPRCSVVKVLLLKRLVKKKVNFGYVFRLTEKEFLERFVTRYLKKVPQLLQVYQGKVDIQDV